MFLTYDFLKREKPSYNNKQILQDIIICRHSTNKKLVEERKVLLFREMSHVTVKYVNYFFVSARKATKEIYHVEDDIVNECFVAFNKCLTNFDYIKFKSFQWYYNQTLSRTMTRLLEKSYKKYIINNKSVDTSKVKHVNFEYLDKIEKNDEGETVYKDHIRLPTHSNEADFIEFYLSKLELDQDDRKIIKSKLDRENIEDFLKKNPKITRNIYYKKLNIIKGKLSFLKDEEI